jgi:hypothetical protein
MTQFKFGRFAIFKKCTKLALICRAGGKKLISVMALKHE